LVIDARYRAARKRRGKPACESKSEPQQNTSPTGKAGQKWKEVDVKVGDKEVGC